MHDEVVTEIRMVHRMRTRKASTRRRLARAVSSVTLQMLVRAAHAFGGFALIELARIP